MKSKKWNRRNHNRANREKNASILLYYLDISQISQRIQFNAAGAFSPTFLFPAQSSNVRPWGYVAYNHKENVAESGI